MLLLLPTTTKDKTESLAPVGSVMRLCRAATRTEISMSDSNWVRSYQKKNGKSKKTYMYIAVCTSMRACSVVGVPVQRLQVFKSTDTVPDERRHFLENPEKNIDPKKDSAADECGV